MRKMTGRAAFLSILEDEGVDGVITLYVPPVMHDPLHVADCIFDAARDAAKPVLCVFMSRDEVLVRVLERSGRKVPVFRFPEAAVRAMGAMARYRAYRDRPAGETPVFDVDRERATRALRKAAAAGRGTLTLDESREVLDAYGIRFARSRPVRSREALRAGALEVGLPVVMKVQSPDISHKTEVGGVIADLRTVAEVEEAWDGMMRRVAAAAPGARVEGVLLQEMRKGAQEMILGVATDPLFGPLLMAGAGGILVEVAGDVAFRVNPVTSADVDEMIAGLRSARLLQGFRGRPPLCVEAYKEAILRLGCLVSDFAGILEADINPFMVGETPEKCVAVDARLRIDPKAF